MLWSRRANGIASTWGHTRLSEMNWHFITQESPSFICGECQDFRIAKQGRQHQRAADVRSHVRAHACVEEQVDDLFVVIIDSLDKIVFSECDLLFCQLFFASSGLLLPPHPDSIMARMSMAASAALSFIGFPPFSWPQDRLCFPLRGKGSARNQ